MEGGKEVNRNNGRVAQFFFFTYVGQWKLTVCRATVLLQQARALARRFRQLFVP